MGVTLTDTMGREFNLNWAAWDSALSLAEHYGWKPSGTSAPDCDQSGAVEPVLWDGSYWGNNFQIVEAEDAKGIARALTRGLLLTVDIAGCVGDLAVFCANSGGFVMW